MILDQGDHTLNQNECGDIDQNGDLDPIIDISDLVILVETILNN